MIELRRRSLILSQPLYQQVEWISPTNHDWNNVYIDLGYKATSKFGIDMTISDDDNYFDNIRQAFTCGGYQDGGFYCDFSHRNDSSYYHWHYAINSSANWTLWYKLPLTSKIILRQRENIVSVNGTSYTFSKLSGQSNRNVWLLNRWIGKLYSCKTYEGNVLVRDMIPCYRKSDGVIGMYDLCGSICPLTGTSFYINGGSKLIDNPFTKGPDVVS